MPQASLPSIFQIQMMMEESIMPNYVRNILKMEGIAELPCSMWRRERSTLTSIY